jgi:DNA primase
VPISQADKAMEYQSYAAHCLRTAALLPDQNDRIIHREMSAEWFKLADQAARKDESQGLQATVPTKAKRADAR